MRILTLLILFCTLLLGYDFNLIKKGHIDSNTTLLVIGGIHGNEPGGYFSAEILASHYHIKSGSLWIVPNLNAKSIQTDTRGFYGDMNRKFLDINQNDPDYKIVSDIKTVILDQNVSLIINLHDGHGFYREKDQGTIFNPKAWGQTCVIDQCDINGSNAYSNMDEIAKQIKININKKLIQDQHIFNVKNTKTKFDDEQMRHSLTYFAVTHHKPAFAIETSKSLSTLAQKVYYQLSAIEEFMQIMHIDYKRDFDFNINELSKIIDDYGSIVINSNFALDLTDIKDSLNYIPLKRSENTFVFSSLIGSIKEQNHSYELYIGNKKITTLRSQTFDACKNIDQTISINVDGKLEKMHFTTMFNVNKTFTVEKYDNLRVNVIGFNDRIHSDESNLMISEKSLDKSYAIDTKSKKYRIEFYDGDRFCGMITANFR